MTEHTILNLALAAGALGVGLLLVALLLRKCNPFR